MIVIAVRYTKNTLTSSSAPSITERGNWATHTAKILRRCCDMLDRWFFHEIRIPGRHNREFENHPANRPGQFQADPGPPGFSHVFRGLPGSCLGLPRSCPSF